VLNVTCKNVCRTFNNNQLKYRIELSYFIICIEIFNNLNFEYICKKKLKIMIYLIDYENIQALPYENLLKDADKVIIFIGSLQTAFKVNEVKLFLTLKNVEIVQAVGINKNNVDFHICYYLGIYAERKFTDFTILSNDKGYDNLLKHLSAGGLNCKRVGKDTIALPTFPIENNMTDGVMDALIKISVRSRPRTVKTLGNYINKQLLPKELRKDKILPVRIIDELKDKGFLNIEKDAVNWKSIEEEPVNKIKNIKPEIKSIAKPIKKENPNPTPQIDAAITASVIDALSKITVRNRPGKIKTLGNYIKTQFLTKELKKDKKRCNRIINELNAIGFLAIDKMDIIWKSNEENPIHEIDDINPFGKTIIDEDDLPF